MCAVSYTDQLPVGTHGVFKLKLHFTHLADFHLNIDDILEGSWVFVFAGDGNDRGEDILRLDLLEAETQLVEPVDTGFFHETDIVGVVRHAHAVALIVFHFVFVGVHRGSTL